MTDVFSSFAEPWLLLLADDPLLRSLQLALLFAGLLVVFLVFYTTRDILTRSHSFPLTLFCIILTAGLPVVGFFIYLLIRPSQTLKQKELYAMVEKLAGKPSKEPVKDSAKQPVSRPAKDMKGK